MSKHIKRLGVLILAVPAFKYESGPDGVRYAIAGEVPIDASLVINNPEATLRKAEIIRYAALAPASAQDRQIAARAVQMALQARSQLIQRNREQMQSQGANTDSDQTVAPSIADQGSSTAADNKASVVTQTQDGNLESDEDDTAMKIAAAQLEELNKGLSRIYERLLALNQQKNSIGIERILDLKV